MNNLKIIKKLVYGSQGKEFLTVKNTSGGILTAGRTVILDKDASTATVVAVTTTTAKDNKLVLGMLTETLAINAFGECQIKGLTNILKVDGTTDIAKGDLLSTFTAAGIAAKATTGKGGIFAIALEAYTANDSLGVIDAYLTGEVGRFDLTVSPAFAAPTGAHVPDCVDTEGAAATTIRSDHIHGLDCDTAVDTTGTSGEGNSTKFARANHAHGYANNSIGSAKLDKGYVYCLAFQYANVAGNLTTQKMNTVEPTTLEYTIPVAGSIIGVSIRSNAAREAGTCTVEVYAGADGNTATGLTAVLNAANPQKHYTVQAKDADALAADNLLNVRITTDAGWLPVTADINVVVWCEMD